MKSQACSGLQEEDERLNPKVSLARRLRADRRLLRGALIVATICFCFSALRSNWGPQPSPWEVLQEAMADQTSSFLKMMFDPSSHSSGLSLPTDSLCWPDTRNLPQRTRLGISADAAFKLDSLCLPHYLASLNHHLENSGLITELKARHQLRLFLAHSWVDPLLSDAPPTKRLSVPPIIHHSGKSHAHATWSKFNPGYVFRSKRQKPFKILVQPIKRFSKVHKFDNPRKQQTPLARKNSQRRSKITSLTSLFNYGGIYAQDSAECLRPFKDWILWHDIEDGGDGRWAGGRDRYPPSSAVRSRGPPSFVVAVETMMSDSKVNWATKHSRPLTISELAFASAPGHPIVLDMMRRISKSLERAETALTDAVLQYVTIMTEGQVHWSDLREVPLEGMRIGDVLVLSGETFATYVRSVEGNFGRE